MALALPSHRPQRNCVTPLRAARIDHEGRDLVMKEGRDLVMKEWNYPRAPDARSRPELPDPAAAAVDALRLLASWAATAVAHEAGQ